MSLRSKLKRLAAGVLSRYPGLQEPKERTVRMWRQARRVPFEKEFEVLAHVSVAPGQSLLDIGANRGQSIDAMRLYHPTARIFAFEANPRMVERLSRMFPHDENLYLKPYGLGAVDGTFKLFLPIYNGLMLDGLASLDRMAAEGWLTPNRMPGFDPARLEIETIGCAIRRLDDEDVDPVFVKIDAQGAEPAILEGGRATLEKSRPLLLIEHDDDPPELLSELGYREFAYRNGGFRPVSGWDDRTSNSFHLTEAHVVALSRAGLRFSNSRDTGRLTFDDLSSPKGG